MVAISCHIHTYPLSPIHIHYHQYISIITHTYPYTPIHIHYHPYISIHTHTHTNTPLLSHTLLYIPSHSRKHTIRSRENAANSASRLEFFASRTYPNLSLSLFLISNLTHHALLPAICNTILRFRMPSSP